MLHDSQAEHLHIKLHPENDDFFPLTECQCREISAGFLKHQFFQCEVSSGYTDKRRAFKVTDAPAAEGLHLSQPLHDAAQYTAAFNKPREFLFRFMIRV